MALRPKLRPNQCPAVCHVTTVVSDQPAWNRKEALSTMVTVGTVLPPVETPTR